MTDDAFVRLLQRAQGGSDTAVAELFAAHLGQLEAYVQLNAGAALRARESCSDLVQTVCREVLQGMGSVDCPDAAAFRSWLLTVTLNKLRKRARFHGAERRNPERERRVEIGETRSDDVVRELVSTLTPSRHAEAREELARMHWAMAQLSEEHREVILQSRLLKRPHRAIAKDLGRSEPAVRQMLSRARAKLAILLDG